MKLNSFIFKQVFKQLNIPASAIKQIELASDSSNVDGRGFPNDLIQLNAPMIARGVLNFAYLQMNRDWIYPFWVHQQLDPKNPSYIPRSQNPLLINVTHRNWTALGSPFGYHEAIVDPRGLVTPLPREWSIDVWLMTSKSLFFPSLSEHADQQYDTLAPNVKTQFTFQDVRLELETFVHHTRRGTDIVFHRASVVNVSDVKQEGMLCIAVRPYNPEGVAPIETIEFKSPRIAYVNGTTGVVFAEDPDGVICSSASEGDIAYHLQKSENTVNLFKDASKQISIHCMKGLAHTVAGFRFNLRPGATKQVHCSAALDTDQALRRSPVKQTWRVSFDKRKSDQRDHWQQEVDQGARFMFADKQLQDLFDISRLTLLQLHDGDFVSPGPYVYHTFWFRDAAIMLHTLDVLGYSKRARQTIDVFPKRLTQEGFFRGPDGEWDSNGAVIWTIYRHYEFNRSELWLREWYPALAKAAGWIQQMRRKSRDTASTARGLMPKSLSAEHLGMVDQYYWDSFWSLAGIRCMKSIAAETEKYQAEQEYQKEVDQFEKAIFQSLQKAEQNTGDKIIPASPFRPFDEGAIGSICSIYPLQLFDDDFEYGRNTLQMLADRYVDEKGFFHPLIHSGYNPYLTLHIAHSLLYTGDIQRAWTIADTVFKQAASTGTYPEAIHPVTGGGTMGDGHHGWAAAEIIMFLRDCLFREKGTSLELFGGDDGRLIRRGTDCTFTNVPTTFGKVGIELQYTSAKKCTVSFSNEFFKNAAPEYIELYLPFEITEYITGNRNFVQSLENRQGRSVLRLSPVITKLYLTMG